MHLDTNRKAVASLLSLSLITGIGFAAGTATAMADEPSTASSAVPSADSEIQRDALRHAGFTDEELTQITNDEATTLYEALISGNHALDEHAPTTRGAYSKLARAILRIFNQLPASVRKAIGPIGKFLDYIDHFTGTTEHIIYSACKAVGMNDWWANFVTKTIMLFL
ncbi:hypothetical protein [Bifidobacterium longum]|uniref:hypothetical protein n=1 Tax=Bifidobacterium longum TaxID=216816 RepID=UPI00080B76BD|nr:hypothetical protein [Bifidobacterium longum]